MTSLIFLSLGMLLLWTLLLSLVVLAHNLGHFTVARLTGLGVARVVFGRGRPWLQGRDRQGTLWQLGWFPLFGHVVLKGDGAAQDAAQDPPRGLAWDELRRAKKLLVLLSGALGNLVLAVLLFFCFFAIFGQPGGSTLVVDVLSGSEAERAGLSAGDHIMTVGETEVATSAQLARALSKGVRETLELNLIRDGRAITLSLPGQATNGQTAKRTRLSAFGLLTEAQPQPVSPQRAFLLALRETAALIRHPLEVLTRRPRPCRIEPPHGLVLCPSSGSCGDMAAMTGPCIRPTLTNRLFYPLVRILPGTQKDTFAIKSIYIFALLSMLFGLLSLLPAPGFDGGRMIRILVGQHAAAFFEGSSSLKTAVVLLFTLIALPILLGVARHPWLLALLFLFLTAAALNLRVLGRGLEWRGRLDVTFLSWGCIVLAMFFIVALAAPI